MTRKWDITMALNCILAGLVSITAGCSVVSDWHAIFIGLIGALVYIGASKAMVAVQLDDPLMLLLCTEHAVSGEFLMSEFSLRQLRSRMHTPAQKQKEMVMRFFDIFS
mmetsp:Transcript_5673/g.7558  ORF Transcript_5673/g.7558 Transcript_5673/m.7558 type:complete len:108 (-) Transcript_5673:96-419(-)